MRAIPLAAILAALMLTGCVTQGELNERSRVHAAEIALNGGEYKKAEAILSVYVTRTEDGELKLKWFGLSGATRKKAIDMIVMLLWETGRDNTLATFADDYLPSSEFHVTQCRLAERQALYQDAYRCWNDIGDVDRAERVIRTEAAIRILRD